MYPISGVKPSYLRPYEGQPVFSSRISAGTLLTCPEDRVKIWVDT